MIIVNAQLEGENAYDITVSESNIFRVYAFNVETALDIVADYLENHNCTNFYLDNLTVELAAKCSKWLTVEAYAKAHKLTRCGTNGIYLEITNVKGCPNG